MIRTWIFLPQRLCTVGKVRFGLGANTGQKLPLKQPPKRVGNNKNSTQGQGQEPQGWVQGGCFWEAPLGPNPDIFSHTPWKDHFRQGPNEMHTEMGTGKIFLTFQGSLHLLCKYCFFRKLWQKKIWTAEGVCSWLTILPHFLSQLKEGYCSAFPKVWKIWRD